MGPLAGFRIIEMAGIGPAPFAAMLLADMGAEIIRVDRREAADLGIPGRERRLIGASGQPHWCQRISECVPMTGT
jgi:crotonobetainyl-CoA:carnitine CoA-transferase CaiB-like acyl-CoA transferase